MTEEGEKQSHKDSLEIKWVVVLAAIIGMFLFGYTALDRRFSVLESEKLDRAVFEEHQINIAAMKGDISRIRDILETHSAHFGTGK